MSTKQKSPAIRRPALLSIFMSFASVLFFQFSLLVSIPAFFMSLYAMKRKDSGSIVANIISIIAMAASVFWIYFYFSTRTTGF